MSISKKDVEHIAGLARIQLSNEEKSKFENELSGILSFIETLNKADTDRVMPVTGGTTLINESREDVPNAIFDTARAALIEEAPESDRNYIKVKSVF